MTLQAMRWFGRVDDADGQRMTDVEKVVHPSQLGYSASVQGWFRRAFFFPAVISRLILTLFLTGTYFNCRVTQMSEDGTPPSAILSFSTHPSSCSR
jgi:hypothetical protein